MICPTRDRIQQASEIYEIRVEGNDKDARTLSLLSDGVRLGVREMEDMVWTF